jgi:hypothetical protein
LRAPVSSASELLKPQSSEPSAKTAIAARKIVRDPTRSATQPLAGMKIARLSR